MAFEITWTLGADAKEANTVVLSDIHWDNPDCNRRAFKRCLDNAIAKDAPVIIPGDFFCAMQGKYDPRASKESIRKEHNKVNYLDALVDTAAEWLKPYAQNIVIIGNGNHETNIAKRHETALLDRLCYKLRSEGGITLEAGYHGFIRQRFILDGNGPNRSSEDWYFHHGYGGGGPVTKGMIDFNRMQQQVDADVYLLGHIHRHNKDRSVTMRLKRNGGIGQRKIDYVRCSTFKQENNKPFGWHVERGMGPRPIGGWWCRHVLFNNETAMKNGEADNKRYVERYWTECG